MQCPIIACPQCHVDFTYPEWCALKLLSSPERSEHRVCECGHVLLVPRATLADLEKTGGLVMSVDTYERLYPDSHRARAERARLEQARVMAPPPLALAPVVMVAVVALAALSVLMVIVWRLF